MINFLHNFNPSPTLLDLGFVKLNYYGFFISLGILVALSLAIEMGKKRGFKKEEILDISFYLIIFGILGARIYDIFLEFPFYLNHPWQVFKIWQGGLAIHGSILAGIITLYILSKKKKINFWRLSAIFVPGLALAQAIGRMGNYFNQELFGQATSLAWGIPIALENRPLNFISQTHFHPTFLYEALGSIIIFFILLYLSRLQLNRFDNKTASLNPLIVSLYVLLYSILRFSLEFIRIDYAPTFLNFKVPQVTSLLMAALAVFIIVNHYVFQKKSLQH